MLSQLEGAARYRDQCQAEYEASEHKRRSKPAKKPRPEKSRLDRAVEAVIANPGIGSAALANKIGIRQDCICKVLSLLCQRKEISRTGVLGSFRYYAATTTSN